MKTLVLIGKILAVLSVVVGVAVLILPVSLVCMRHPAELSLLVSTPLSLALLFILSVPCTVVAFSWMNRYQPQVSASEAGIIYGAEPLFTSLLALFLPGVLAGISRIQYSNERLSARLILGGGLVVSANVLVQLPWSPRLFRGRN